MHACAMDEPAQQKRKANVPPGAPTFPNYNLPKLRSKMAIHLAKHLLHDGWSNVEFLLASLQLGRGRISCLCSLVDLESEDLCYGRSGRGNKHARVHLWWKSPICRGCCKIQPQPQKEDTMAMSLASLFGGEGLAANPISRQRGMLKENHPHPCLLPYP